MALIGEKYNESNALWSKGEFAIDRKWPVTCYEEEFSTTLEKIPDILKKNFLTMINLRANLPSSSLRKPKKLEVCDQLL